MALYLGLDTSCYVCSLAVVDENGRVQSDLRRPLEVPAGKLGLRQQEAVWQHVTSLPQLIGQSPLRHQRSHFKGVAASGSPRPNYKGAAEGSYMPVFRVGVGYGKALAVALGVPFQVTSHQEGHLLTALGGDCPRDPFLAVHVSGGTTEVLLVKPECPLPRIQLISGTSDISAGQLVDRVGRLLGLKFPAGPRLEELAGKSGSNQITLPVAMQDRMFSFSGPEAAARRLVEAGQPPEAIARAVEICIARTLTGVLAKIGAAKGIDRVVFFGGVMANRFIRAELARELQDWQLQFAPTSLSGDNAVGVAHVARMCST